ncbi:MAG TPA: sulfatase-like hydrolase/transferase, partial [Bdellovibrionales bacterium]|nr:sulfatase-like hydrolase/transferase [Bdellovibrionales bacterium]
LCGLPALMAEPIITSDFSNNRLDCLPKILGQMGYSTYFLHGAHNGSMHFDTFSKIAGFESFVGLDEYPKDNPADLDQYWGVLDEPMLQYAVKTLDRAPKPALLSVFTLSSHHPYYIPEQHRGKFPKGTLEIHESIGYTDLALKEFFKTAESRPWFNDTIFVITADHTQKSDRKKYADLIGAWRVPLFIYVPGLKPGQAPLPAKDRITQHVDIMPTILDLLGVTLADRLLVGQSVFSDKPGYAYNYTSAGYWYLDPKIMLDYRRDNAQVRAETHVGTYRLQSTAAERPEIQEGLLNLKATVHYMNEGLLRNSLHTWKEIP